MCLNISIPSSVGLLSTTTALAILATILSAWPAFADNWTNITPWVYPGRDEIPKSITTRIDEGRDLAGGQLVQGTTYEYKVVAVGDNYWQESNTATNTPCRVVVLVRGWGPRSEQDYWGTFKRCLTNDQFEVWDATGALDCTQGVDWNVGQLSDYIRGKIWERELVGAPVPKRLGVISHSMGGVIIRAYMARGPQIPVDCVVMTSPANCGSWLATWLLSKGPFSGLMRLFTSLFGDAPASWESTRDLTVEASLMRNAAMLRDLGQSPETGTRYYTVAGSKTRLRLNSLFYWFASRLIQQEIRDNHPDPKHLSAQELLNDGVIAVDSSHGVVSRAAAHFYATAHPALSEQDIIRYFGVKGFAVMTSVDLDHSEIRQTSDVYFRYVKPMLFDTYTSGILAADHNLGSREATVGEDDVMNHWQMLPLYTGTILSGQTKRNPITVDASAQAEFLLNWSTGVVTFVLYSPDGSRLTPASTNSNPDVIYTEEAGMMLYQISNPPVGIWMAEITAVTVGSGGADYAGISFLDNQLGLTIDRDRLYSPTNSAVTILGRLMDSGTPITNATVMGWINSPDGTTNSVSLFDDGLHADGVANDGVYGTLFTATLQEGMYGIDLVAHGQKSNGEGFERAGMGQTTFTIFEPTAVFTDVYDDYGVDLAPTNGLIEELVVEVGVDARAAGRFTVAGTLTSTNGVRIAEASTELLVTNLGAQTVELKYPAAPIYDSKVIGGFDVRNLILCGTDDNFALLDLRTNAYATAGYDFYQFAKSDRDNDGLSDGEELTLYHTDPENPDSDFDGMPDGWEVRYRLNPLKNDGDVDSDGDGATNLQEFLAGTDPTNPGDVFKMNATVNQFGIVLSLPTMVDCTYTIETTCDLGSISDWIALRPAFGGTGGMVSVTDTNVAGQRFYRAKISMR